MLWLKVMAKIHSGFALALFTLASFTAACGSDDDDGKGGGSNGAAVSCMDMDGQICIELVGAAGAGADAVRDQCNQSQGVVGSGCSRNGASGVCTFQVGQAASRQVYYGLEADEIDGV